jgi:putative tryptophan/tyrosine transport system substrate-binding protein
MRRRDFIKAVAGSSAAWSLAAHAQQPTVPVVGFLRSVSLADAADLVTAFRQGLKEAGYIEGQNVAIELRSAEGHLDRLPALVGDLIHRPVAAIVGNLNAALAAKAATTTIPIIFASGSDPVRDGLVASLNRPGGNITGVAFLVTGLGAKRLDLLRQLVPKANLIAMLVNPGSVDTEAERRDVQGAAQRLGQQLIILDASSDRDIETSFTTFVQRGAGALMVGAGASLFIDTYPPTPVWSRVFAEMKIGDLSNYGISMNHLSQARRLGSRATGARPLLLDGPERREGAQGTRAH